MDRGVFLNEAVKILRKRKDKVEIEYEDGFVEWVDLDQVTIYQGVKRSKIKPVNKKRKTKNFKKHFHSEEFVIWIKNRPCVVCGLTPSDTAHIKSRISGGYIRNVVPLCRTHHTESHTIGLKSFEEKYSIDLQSYADSLYVEAVQIGLVPTEGIEPPT